jgi:hypothetical protein
VRADWVARYNARLRAFRVLGLSVGAPKEDLDLKYLALSAELEGIPDQREHLQELQSAYDLLRQD